MNSPRKFKYKNFLKKRKNYKNPIRGQNLSYGSFGLRVNTPTMLNSKHINRYKLFLKKLSKKSELTRRKTKINVFPNLPATKKVTGSRMGKGKGKMSTWYTEIKPCTLLVEVKNSRPGRSLYFLNQLSYRLGSSTKIISSRKDTSTFFKNKLNINCVSLW